ncbi:hypothetical protein SLS56_006818 [Neofusicoccum ribis]|uniref:Uncharacterized protein n=1 Tax=Neofusicoccum ribis TaxID=45134 RepID=A0ABR3SPM2_9PEZI
MPTAPAHLTNVKSTFAQFVQTVHPFIIRRVEAGHWNVKLILNVPKPKNLWKIVTLAKTWMNRRIENNRERTKKFQQQGKNLTHVEVSNVVREDQKLSAFLFLLALDKSEWLGVMTKVKDQGWLDEHENESSFVKNIRQIGKSSVKLQEVAAAVRDLGTDPVTGKGEKLQIGTNCPFNARMIYYSLREALHVAEGEVCLLTKDSRKSTQEIFNLFNNLITAVNLQKQCRKVLLFGSDNHADVIKQLIGRVVRPRQKGEVSILGLVTRVGAEQRLFRAMRGIMSMEKNQALSIRQMEELLQI